MYTRNEEELKKEDCRHSQQVSLPSAGQRKSPSLRAGPLLGQRAISSCFLSTFLIIRVYMHHGVTEVVSLFFFLCMLFKWRQREPYIRIYLLGNHRESSISVPKKRYQWSLVKKEKSNFRFIMNSRFETVFYMILLHFCNWF